MTATLSHGSPLRFQLGSAETWPNPWPMYAALRDHDPVHHVIPAENPDHDYWVLSRHIDVWEAARDNETFSSAQGLTVNYGELEIIGLAEPRRTDAGRAGAIPLLRHRYYPRRWQRRSRAPARRMATPPRDSQGRYCDGGKTYKITLPGPVPVGRFWFPSPCTTRRPVQCSKPTRSWRASTALYRG